MTVAQALAIAAAPETATLKELFDAQWKLVKNHKAESLKIQEAIYARRGR